MVALPKNFYVFMYRVKLERLPSVNRFLTVFFSNLDGVAVVQDFYSILQSFPLVLCIPLISWFLLLDHNINDSKLIQ